MPASPTSRPKTADDLIALEAETGERFEVVDGAFVEVHVSRKSSSTNSKFNRYLGDFVDKHHLGEVFDSEMIFDLPRSTRHADVSVVLTERLPGDEDVSRFVGAPDVVVEVVSPTDRFSSVRRKVQEWLDAGAQVVWLANPESAEVSVYRRGHSVRTLGIDDTLDGEDVLPGFSVAVSDLFPARTTARQEMSRDG